MSTEMLEDLCVHSIPLTTANGCRVRAVYALMIRFSLVSS